eukprot:g20152.t2
MERDCIAACEDGRCRKSYAALLQVRGHLERHIEGDNFQLLANEDGNCLEASNAAMNGIWPSMEACDAENSLQHWRYEQSLGAAMAEQRYAQPSLDCVVPV